MLRRINWYLQAWPQLAGLYEQAFRHAANAQEMRERVTEYDNVFGRQFLEQPVSEPFPMRRWSAMLSSCVPCA
jgi:hypothetical protein